MKIIYGGSFNPPTIAHKNTYFVLDKIYNFDEFIFLPVSSKYNKNGLISDEHRINMLNILIKDMPKAKISLKECLENSYKGTYDILKDEDKDTYFLMGSDNLRDITKWINYELLIKERKFIILSRDNMNDEEYINSVDILKENKDNFVLIKNFDYKVSSSAFRLNKDKSIIPTDVLEYIKNNKLYMEV